MSTINYRTMSSFVWEGQLHALKIFLQNEHVHVDDPDENGQTVLILAAELGNYAIVQELINRNADVNAEDNDNWTALLIAAKQGHAHVVQLLIDSGAQIEHGDMNGWSALVWACYKNHDDIVKMLLNGCADANSYGQYNLSCLAWAAGRNRLSIVRQLLAHSAKVNQSDKYGTTPLVWACRKGSLPIVQELLKAGANVDASGMFCWTPLLVATQGNFTEIVLMLLDRKPNVNAADKDGFTSLSIACKNGNNAIVQALLNCGAYVNLTDKDGDTCLIHAVKGGHTEVVSSLIHKYADINIQGSEKKTALYWAVEKSNVQIAKILLTANPDLDLANVDGDTPLMRATRNRLKELVQMLLDKNAKVHAVDKKGDTVLHIAMRSQSKSMVEVLLRNPKNSKLLYKANKSEETPYSMDASLQKSILANIFGARRLNTNEDNENLLGYDLYSSCLADILSEPSLSVPICVGLYAKWGSGKSFLLDKLQEEMKNFSAQVVYQLFSFSWTVILLCSQISLLAGILLGMATQSLIAGAIAVAISFVFTLAFLGLVWFGCHRLDWSWCYAFGEYVVQKVNDCRLILQMLFCHPPNQRREWQMQSIRFLFTSQTKSSCCGTQMSVNQIIQSLHEAVELEWGKIVPRLYSVLKPNTVDSEKKKLRRTCSIPTIIVAAVFYICFVISIMLLSYFFGLNKTTTTIQTDRQSDVDGTNSTVYYDDVDKNVGSPAVVFLFVMAFLLVLLLVVNLVTLANLCSALLLPSCRKKKLHKASIRMAKGKSDTHLQDVRKQVSLISGLVKCMDGFTGRRTRIVIVLDGLDSCEQDKVLNMLDTVRLLFSDQNTPFVTLLAIDPHVIIKAIESNLTRVLNDNTINGYDYLNNIIHLPFYLQNSALRGVEVSRYTAHQNQRKSSLISNEESYKASTTNHRDSTVSMLSINQSFRSKAALKMRLNEKMAGLGANIFSKRVLGAHDLTKVLLNDDYFSDVNPRSMRRLMNVVYVTGRLMKAFNIDFNWYHMASWINITEQWPYRTSWIIFYYENHEKELDDEVSLRFIHDQVNHMIPVSKEIEPMIEVDRNSKKFEVFLKYHTSSLRVAEMKVFRPFTINLDPYILKIIKENVKNVEEARNGPQRPSQAHGGPRNRRNNSSFDYYSRMAWPSPYPYSYGPMEMYGQAPPIPDYSVPKRKICKAYAGMTENVHLSDMKTEDVCKLVSNIEGISQSSAATYQANLAKHNISGLVLMTCDLSELKGIINMSFGHWEMFRQAITMLKQNELSARSSNESLDSLPSNLSCGNSKYVRNRRSSKSQLSNLEKKAAAGTADEDRCGDQLTKQVTLEETMIFGALQSLNDEAKEDALKVQRYQQSSGRRGSITVHKHPGYSSSAYHPIMDVADGADDHHHQGSVLPSQETEVLYLTSPPSSPKLSHRMVSVVPNLQVEQQMPASHTFTNMQSICKNHKQVHFEPTTRPAKLPLSSSSSLEKLNTFKHKIINAISPNLSDRRNITKSISPLALPNETTMLMMMMMPPDDDDDDDHFVCTNNTNRNACTTNNGRRPPLERQSTIQESTCSSRFKQYGSDDNEDEEESKADTSVAVAEGVAGMFQMLATQLTGVAPDVSKDDAHHIV